MKMAEDENRTLRKVQSFSLIKKKKTATFKISKHKYLPSAQNHSQQKKEKNNGRNNGFSRSAKGWGVNNILQLIKHSHGSSVRFSLRIGWLVRKYLQRQSVSSQLIENDFTAVEAVYKANNSTQSLIARFQSFKSRHGVKDLPESEEQTEQWYCVYWYASQTVHITVAVCSALLSGISSTW